MRRADSAEPLHCMSNHLFWNFRRSRRLAVVVFALFAIACGGGKKNVIPSNSQPDRYLMDRANEAVGKKEWLKAREYFRQVVDNYPGSPLRPDAKLGIGDTFLNEGGTENYVLGGTFTTPGGEIWSATARTSRLNRDDFGDVRNTVASVPTTYNSLEFGWRGAWHGQRIGLDLGVEMIEPEGAERDVQPYGFVRWTHAFGL